MGEHVAPTTPAKKKRSNIFWNIVGVVGELLITFAIIVGLFSVWQLYWTTYQVSGQVSQTIASYE
ncbi:MAG: class E sortase, partial [Actinomyces sp.]|nr:class E sortase [Actinomyces sp.]